MSALYMPLDIHTGRMGRNLGLLNRKQSDWKAVEELTASLRELHADDPVRYDYSLFGLGISGDDILARVSCSSLSTSKYTTSCRR